MNIDGVNSRGGLSRPGSKGTSIVLRKCLDRPS